MAMSVDLCMSSESESIMSRLGQSDWQESVAFKQSWHQHHLDPANGLTFWPDAINWYEASSSLLSLQSLGPRGAGSTWALGGPSKNLLHLYRTSCADWISQNWANCVSRMSRVNGSHNFGDFLENWAELEIGLKWDKLLLQSSWVWHNFMAARFHLKSVLWNNKFMTI